MTEPKNPLQRLLDLQAGKTTAKDVLVATHRERRAQADADTFAFAGIGARLTDLHIVAHDLLPHLREAAQSNDPEVTDREFMLGEISKVTEEAGEVLKALLRLWGISRTRGTREDVMAELADTVIASYVAAELLGQNLGSAIEAKLRVVYERGWTTVTEADLVEQASAINPDIVDAEEVEVAPRCFAEYAGTLCMLPPGHDGAQYQHDDLAGTKWSPVSK